MGGEFFVDGVGAIGEGAGAVTEEAGEFEAAPVGDDNAPAADALPIVTSGVILPIVGAETPAFDKSLTEEYGRPEMIFFAVASPTPGNSFSSAALAVFRSTFAPATLGALDFVWALDLLEPELTATGVALPNVTRGVILLMVVAEMPAFDKSLIEEYGRPETIFFAVAVPTPGKLSNSCSLALFRSTFALVLLDWFADPELTGA